MGHQAAAVALAPILFAQGRYVRRVTPVLPEPPGPRAGATGTGLAHDARPLRLLIVGDSAAAGVGAPSQAAALSGRTVAALADVTPVVWRLVARTGATTRGTLRHLASLPDEPFDVAVVSLGVNDVTRGVPPRAWLGQQRTLVATLRAKFGARRVLLCGLPPMHAFPALPQPLRWYLGARARRLDGALRGWAAGEPDCEYVPLALAPDPRLMAADGFHPGPEAYARWGADLARRIRAWRHADDAVVRARSY